MESGKICQFIYKKEFCLNTKKIYSLSAMASASIYFSKTSLFH